MKKDFTSWSIKFIPHKLQRYDTLGDYQEFGQTWRFKISDTGDWRMNSLLAIHEIIEKVLNKQAGVTDKVVDEWDFNCKDDEPGENPNCPYFSQHKMATLVEMLICAQFGIKWKEYEKKLEEI